MGRKSKHKSKRRAKPQKTVPQRPLKSSWGAAVVSFLKEFFLNVGDSWYNLSYEEDLSDEGKRKKDLIWGPILLISAVLTALLPFYRWEFVVEQSLPVRFFLVLAVEAVAIGIGIGSIVMIKNAIKTKSNKKDQRR